MNIKQMTATVRSARDLSPSAREVTLTLPNALEFTPGAFVNLFVTRDGKRERRAYSVSSDYKNQKEITLSIRRNDTPQSLSPVFWQKNLDALPVSVMGPLGLNTADKIEHSKVYLFGFGIGVSVIKSLAQYLLDQEDIEQVIVLVGSRTEKEALYKEFFELLAEQDVRLSFRSVLSRPEQEGYPYVGYLQDHIGDYDFNDSTVYLCGAGAHCLALRDAIEATHPKNVQFLIESFDS